MLRRKEKSTSSSSVADSTSSTAAATAMPELSLPPKALFRSNTPSPSPSPTTTAFPASTHGHLLPSSALLPTLHASPTTESLPVDAAGERVSFDESSAKEKLLFARQNQSATELRRPSTASSEGSRRKSFGDNDRSRKMSGSAHSSPRKLVKRVRSHGTLLPQQEEAELRPQTARAISEGISMEATDSAGTAQESQSTDPVAHIASLSPLQVQAKTEPAKRSLLLRRGTFSLFGNSKKAIPPQNESQPIATPEKSATLPSLPSLHFSDDMRMSWSPSGRLRTSPAAEREPDSPLSLRTERPRTSPGLVAPVSPAESKVERLRSNSDAARPSEPRNLPAPLLRSNSSQGPSPSPERPRSPLFSSRRGTGSSSIGNGGMFSAVSALFSSSTSSPAQPTMSLGSRSGASTPLTSPARELSASEFGSLFDTTRKRGLSLGTSGLLGRSRASSNASLGSNHQIPTASSSSLVVPAGDASPAGKSARTRAITDPKKYSIFANNSSASILASGAPGRGWSTPPISPSATKAQLASRPRGMSIKRDENETPNAFVERAKTQLPKADITKALSQSGDAFHSEALQIFLSSFDFTSQPLDVALRLFLLSASLPPETQQIDRCMEAFAKRYHECNPGLFEKSDTAYILAFSLVMLSTDAFNTANKHKMTKQDYVKNLRDQHVPEIVLEYFYDQITLTPFVFSEEDDDNNAKAELGYVSSPGLLNRTVGSTRDKGKIDVYSMIVQDQVYGLRADIERYVPAKSPFSFTGTTSFFNATALHDAFARAPVLQIQPAGRSSGRSSAAVSPVAVPAGGADLEPVATNTTFAPPQKGSPLTSLKVAKVGLLSRKDDLAEGGRKASSRKWRGWTVVLTGSQLLFFKDPNWAVNLTEAIETAKATIMDDQHVLVFPSHAVFKPDAVLSLANSVAIHDFSYSKYSHVFRLIGQEGRQYLFQARSDDDLNSWLAYINYAASFKTAGLRMRSKTKRRSSMPKDSSLAAEKMSTIPAPVVARVTTGDVVSSPESEVPPSLPAPSLADSHKLQDSKDSKLSQGLGAEEAQRSEPRSIVIRGKIDVLERDIARTKEKLHEELRKARILAVLTPFLRSTRERIQAAVIPIEVSVRQLRISLARLVCYREVLARELLMEEREQERSRHSSLRRAQRQPARPSVESFSSALEVPHRRFFGRLDSDSERDRDSFESAREAIEPALTDDELDRLRPPAPPPMQRTHSEQLPRYKRANGSQVSIAKSFEADHEIPIDGHYMTASNKYRGLSRLRSPSGSMSSLQRATLSMSLSATTTSSLAASSTEQLTSSAFENDSEAFTDSPVDPSTSAQAVGRQPRRVMSSIAEPFTAPSSHREPSEERSAQQLVAPHDDAAAEAEQEADDDNERTADGKGEPQKASEWNETKAARRVSLIRYDRLQGVTMPSTTTTTK